MRFIPSIAPSPSESEKPSWWFVFSGRRLWVEPSEEGYAIPRYSEFPGLAKEPAYMGVCGDISCRAAQTDPNGQMPQSLAPVLLRDLYGRMDKELYKIAGMAFHMLNWENRRRFCGACGQPTQRKSDERARHCPHCDAVEYPSMSPAVIVAVVRGDQLLLARSSRFPNAKMYSVLAGFHESGETLEECVAREVREEVGIEVENIRYFGSQSWPFSSSLMIGFTADYAGGEITPDNLEIVDAGWYAANNLPEIPGWGSISKDLIDWFVKRNGG